MAAQYVSDQQGYPPPGKAAYPTQAADQGDQYPQSSQVYPPPSYDYKPQPVTFGTTTVVVGAQPTATTTTVSTPKEERKHLAIGALILSLVVLFLCTSIISLACTIPAIILASGAMATKGSKQKTLAGFSIGLSVVAVVCTVLVIVAVSAYASTAVASISSSSTRYTYRYRG